MTVALILENKNTTPLSMENRITSPTWDDTEKTWDEMDETWDSQGTPLFDLESKNTLTLTLETK